MKRGVQIVSYFSLPTDLAAEMRDWPEFRSGADYDVDLWDDSTGEAVTVRLIARSEEESSYVTVTSIGDGPLFERVLGRVVYSLSAHSDNLMVDRTA